MSAHAWEDRMELYQIKTLFEVGNCRKMHCIMSRYNPVLYCGWLWGHLYFRFVFSDIWFFLLLLFLYLHRLRLRTHGLKSGSLFLNSFPCSVFSSHSFLILKWVTNNTQLSYWVIRKVMWDAIRINYFIIAFYGLIWIWDSFFFLFSFLNEIPR